MSNEAKIAKARQALEDAMEAEIDGLLATRRQAAKQGLSPMATRGGKRTLQCKQAYRATAPATARTTEQWANRVA